MQTATASSTPHVTITDEARVLQIHLNRPQQLNALTTSMCNTIATALRTVTPETHDCVIFTAAGDKGFCGGGDVKAMLHSASAARAFLQAEYEMDRLIAVCPVPTVAIMHGITMGGGIGIAAHCATRIVTADTTLAMPETRIGIVPDVGINRLLAATPAGFGELIAATSCTFNAADALASGFADYYLPPETLTSYVKAVQSGVDPVTAAKQFAQEPTGAAATIAIAARLNNLLREKITHTDPVAQAQQFAAALARCSSLHAAQLAQVCPQTAVIALARVARLRSAYAVGESLDPTTALARDYRLLTLLVTRNDFKQGVTSRLITKDNRPQWQPATLAAVSSATTMRLLAAENPTFQSA
ncbi:enoyl-CoA hydratase/isomerase family protein [Canibacter oris]|uniref:3-hydroxyisobutyryl-CoA hydrolase n=1 Tax=Canibacter oris TaxID=1365628 RepID=A0A840DQD5_9MICO|nr:enoyl-CoA hydratase/isomerase family protein [Canibacter oris]MBB4072228.1 enoyl-CoA hydratase [Canibacter oris]